MIKARRALATKLLRRWKSCRWWHSERALTATKLSRRWKSCRWWHSECALTATKLSRRWKSCWWWHSECALTATKLLLVLATVSFQYAMDLTQTARACALLLRIRKVQRKKRHWVHPTVSKRLLNGQFYKLYGDLRNCRGKIFSYFRMSTESFDKLPVLRY
jgi:hypothetical protein